ncbi:MAG: DUF1501 domain-containing protein [Bacteroidia bacterium]|nr:DUF1501 domain-containing protein [Bacteroidia bacterium]
MNRRHFVQYTSAGVLLPALVNGFSFRALAHSSPVMQALAPQAGEGDRVLVIVQLGGGNDGLNTVVPIDQYSQLNRLRSQVILPESQLLPLSGLDSLALHPSMGGIRTLFDEGRAQILQSVGYPNQNFSHFRSTDIWMTGSDAEEVLNSGWTGRYLHYEYPNFPAGYPNPTMPDPLAIEIGYSLSLTLQGPMAGMGMAISDPSSFYNYIGGIPAPVPPTPAGEQLAYLRLVANQSRLYGNSITSAFSRVTRQRNYPARNYLADQLKIVARLIAGGLRTRVYLVHIDGFDTHANQVDPADHSKGQHASLLTLLSNALAAFQADLREQGVADRVLTMTVSEFGRRIIANNSLGTDHGAAAPLLLFGDAVQGGVLGSNPVIPASADAEDNIPMQFDFRSVYATVLRDWFCVPEPDMQGVILHNFPSLPLVRVSTCVPDSVRELNQQAGQLLLVNYPNPFTDETRIAFESAGGQTLLQVFSSAGKLLMTPVSGDLPAGDYSWTLMGAELAPGAYYCRLQTGSLQQVRAMIRQ